MEMAWSSQSDIDLHILEPDKTHIYFGRKQNRIGFLDIDYTKPDGPEHYFTNSSSLQEGVYEVRANEWRGLGSTRVTFQIAAGPEFIIKEILTADKPTKDIKAAPYFDDEPG